MRNEHGITLVELLAVLAIFGIILALITSVFINGKKASDRGVTNQMLQQEANYILETIRKEYLILEGSDIELEASNSSLLMDEKIISNGYKYEFSIPKEESYEIVNSIIIYRNESNPIELTIKKDKLSFTIDTTLSKLN